MERTTEILRWRPKGTPFTASKQSTAAQPGAHLGGLQRPEPDSPHFMGTTVASRSRPCYLSNVPRGIAGNRISTRWHSPTRVRSLNLTTGDSTEAAQRSGAHHRAAAEWETSLHNGNRPAVYALFIFSHTAPLRLSCQSQPAHACPLTV